MINASVYTFSPAINKSNILWVDSCAKYVLSHGFSLSLLKHIIYHITVLISIVWSTFNVSIINEYNFSAMMHLYFMPFQVKCYFTRLFFSWYQNARQKQIMGYCYNGSIFTTILLTFTFHIVEQLNTIGNIIFKLTLIEIDILLFRYKLLCYAFFKWWKKIFN